MELATRAIPFARRIRRLIGTANHHEKEEGIDQVVNDKATQGREGKLEHVLVDHETVANRTEMGPFIVIDIDCSSELPRWERPC